MPKPAPPSVGQEPGESIVDCWPVLCTGNDGSNEYFQFGPVYAFTNAGLSAYRVANYHLWFTGDGNGSVQLGDAAMFAPDGSSSIQADQVSWQNPACLQGGAQGNVQGGGYNVVNHAILSLPRDMCFAFMGPNAEITTTIQAPRTVNLTRATSTVPPSLASADRLTSEQGRHVAVLGDSFASGEGTYNNGLPGNPPSVDYYPSTQVTSGGQSGCHRSPAAYGPLLGVPETNFVACSGATTKDVATSWKDFRSQLLVLGPATKVVILSVTGDDLGFGSILDGCINVPVRHSRADAACNTAITTHAGADKIAQAMLDLKSLWSTIESVDTGVNIIQVGYPRFFPVSGYQGCNEISIGNQMSLNFTVDQVDYALANTAADDPRVTFVDVRQLFTGHEICGDSLGSYINDLQQNFAVKANCPPGYVVNAVCSQSFHPNTTAYAAEKDLLMPTVKQLLGVS